MSKFFYNLIGGTSLSLGVMGAFLPILPSTCFILLASWAFANSSPTFHNWLYFNSPFSESIQNWKQHRVIPLKARWIATASITASYSISFILINNVYILSGLGVGLAILLLFLHSKPSEVQEIQPVTYSQSPKLHQPII